MAIPYEDLAGMGDVLSPEALITEGFSYEAHRQMHGLGQAHSGDYRHGLGKTFVQRGQADLEPGDYGYQFVSTTKPGTTVFGRQQGRVGVDRRMQLTRQIEELEFLTGTPGVHPRALAQKVWAARRALMGAGDWSWASYADPRERYDAKADLEARLRTVERLIGVDKLNPRLQMAVGSGAMSGLGMLPAWGSSGIDPISKLASCIRGALCSPSSFCCPPGTTYSPRDGDRIMRERAAALPPRPPIGVGGGGGGGDPWHPWRPWEKWIDPPTKPDYAIRDYSKPVEPEPAIAIPGGGLQPKPAVALPGGDLYPKVSIAIPSPTVRQAAPTPISKPAPALISKPAPTPISKPAPVAAKPVDTCKNRDWAGTCLDDIKARAMATSPQAGGAAALLAAQSSPALLAGLGALGRRPLQSMRGVEALKASMRQARVDAAARRRGR